MCVVPFWWPSQRRLKHEQRDCVALSSDTFAPVRIKVADLGYTWTALTMPKYTSSSHQSETVGYIPPAPHHPTSRVASSLPMRFQSSQQLQTTEQPGSNCLFGALTFPLLRLPCRLRRHRLRRQRQCRQSRAVATLATKELSVSWLSTQRQLVESALKCTTESAALAGSSSSNILNLRTSYRPSPLTSPRQPSRA